MNLLLHFLVDSMGSVLIAAAVIDVISMRIPNFLSLALVALFAIHALAIAMPLHEVLWHVISGAVVLGVGFGLFVFGLIGGGDVKLLAAVSLLVGWKLLLPLLLTVAVVGAALGVLVLKLRSTGVMNFLASHGLRGAFFESKRAYIPYAVAIAAGWFLVVLV